jgi:cobalt-zinc-cadmium efflux system protein
MSNQQSHTSHEAHHHYVVPFFLILVFAIVEVLGGWWTGSLALLSDAGHMFSDVAALGLAWVGAIISRRPNPARHASGISYAELIVSVINAITMFVVIALIVVEALERFKVPQAVQGFEVMVIAIIGLVVNLIVAKQLHHQAHHHGDSLNNRAAFLHVMGDVLGSIAAIAAGLVIYLTGWMLIDPILSLLISVLLLVFTLKLVRDIWHAIHAKSDLHDHPH